MLKEVRDDNRENDAEHMKPVSICRSWCRVLLELKLCRTDEITRSSLLHMSSLVYAK